MALGGWDFLKKHASWMKFTKNESVKNYFWDFKKWLSELLLFYTAQIKEIFGCLVKQLTPNKSYKICLCDSDLVFERIPEIYFQNEFFGNTPFGILVSTNEKGLTVVKKDNFELNGFKSHDG